MNQLISREIYWLQKCWLNIAEIELSAVTSQCLARRIDSMDKLSEELKAWQLGRNTHHKTVKEHILLVCEQTTKFL